MTAGDAHGIAHPEALWWFAGWVIAVAVLLLAGARLPLQWRGGRAVNLLGQASVVVTALAVAVLANIALTLHDSHIDLTRDKTFTPSPAALAVVDSLDRPVSLTYFYRAQDPSGQRMRTVLDVMGTRNPLLTLRVVDPDRDPALARTAGLRMANSAILEADGRRLLVETTDESQLAIGIQRVLRREQITVCFVEGHNELPMDNDEFHTHLEGVAGHSHDDASSAVIETTGHGVGRLRRALEGQGYETRKLVLATEASVPGACRALILASPRTTFLPAEVRAIEQWLTNGGGLMALFDLGFEPGPDLERLLARYGLGLPQQAVIDPLSHHASDPGMVAITAYEPTPLTRGLSMTFFPGARPLDRLEPAPAGLTLAPLFYSSRDSYRRTVRAVMAAPAAAAGAEAGNTAAQAGRQLLAVAVEGQGSNAARPPRLVVVGDGDFASNSFLPYLANSDLALAAVRWLVREEQTAIVTTRIPVPAMIVLSNQQMRTIFLGVAALLPLSVVLIGFVVWWRRRQ